MSTGRLSRPSSAASYSSRHSHASYASHASRSSHSGSELKQECKAAYLSVLDDISDTIGSKQDFILLLQQCGRNLTQKAITRYWDSDKESMTFEEFVDVCRMEPATSEDDLIKAFRKIDVNGDGFISLDELYNIMTTKGERLSREEVKMMIDDVDENKDGRLNYKEFCHMFMATTEECKKLSLKALEKKERRRKRRDDGLSAASRKDKEESSVAGSQASLHSASSERQDRKQSQVSLRSDDLPKPSPRGNKKSPVISRLSEPKGLRDWSHAQSKGCFFVDESKGFVSHQYQLTLTEDTSVWITIQPLKLGERGPVDTAVYILQEDKEDEDAFIAFTEQRDGKGCHGVRCDLTSGTYSLVPFTTGCRLTARKGEPSKEAKLITTKDDKIVLTKPFRAALEEIFDVSDLDGNNLLSREEFSWFNIRTSDDQVADDEWQVVEENVDMKEGEISKLGFIQLNEMEAEDNEGDTDDLWITLNNMGFNRALQMDEACPFLLSVFAEFGKATLKVTELDNPGKTLENAVCTSVMAKGERSPVKGMKDLTLYTYVGDARATLLVDNKSRTKVTLELDCSRSVNCVSNHGSLIYTVTVPGHSRKVAGHMLPGDERGEWSIRCAEVILK
ncbi:EF-hand calcium-binding domain-containing protein 7-like isoform X2 [Babylonia areolata]|uniref:EF-hand calcium-binding domain-containing protein 7-like isoform X2 n=1 Tax=Babylonia areolata TaxID=304850 RepID=UPI003FD445CF